MAKSTEQIVVAGDNCVDWISIEVDGLAQDSRGSRPNWKLLPGTRMVAKGGGALLMKRFVEAAAKPCKVDLETDEAAKAKELAKAGKRGVRKKFADVNVVGETLFSLEKLSPDDIIHSMFTVKLSGEVEDETESARLKPSGKKETKEEPKTKSEIYRVQNRGGAAGPMRIQLPAVCRRCKIEPIKSARLLLLDDAGNGFRHARSCWPALLDEGGTPSLVLLKICRPLAQGLLWNQLVEKHLSRLVVVVDADDLRASGASINFGLSWERTASDCVRCLGEDDQFKSLCECPHLIIRFGCEGVLYRRLNGGVAEFELFFDPLRIEGDVYRETGDMIGAGSVLCATLAAYLALDGVAAIPIAIKQGIRRMQKLFALGFRMDADGDLDYPLSALFEAGDPRDIPSVTIGEAAAGPAGDYADWSIAADNVGWEIRDAACDLVRNGEAALLRGAPSARFGEKFYTVDRNEIESYRALRNLILEYTQMKAPKRPLSIAVFGPPGAGKSYGIKALASSLKGANITAKGLEFNISQFRSPGDLIPALHQVRDTVLGGEVPLVFFDEFDSALGGEALGWLKYFLMPMQDGAFREGEAIHPIGRSIFVFAGGTFDSFKDFREGKTSAKSISEAELREVKHPDFVSRLRGHLSVLGPNPFDPVKDRMYPLRRALLIRSQFEKRPGLFVKEDGKQKLQMAPSLLEALLGVPRYRHGARSIESIIDMSLTAGKNAFDQSALPTADQLDLHVDPRYLLALLRFSPKINLIARELHERYKERNRKRRGPGDSVMKPWEQLDDDSKGDNCDAALNIPFKLSQIGCACVLLSDPAREHEPTRDEIEILARLEHNRWVSQKLKAGWRLGSLDGEKDPVGKLHPDLVPWDELEGAKGDPQQIDRDQISDIAAALRAGGLKIAQTNPARPRRA